ncbi:MAG: hypothetical protein D6765_12595 [Bacteroidetes bacterium]|nr:MAG: hypothetical protein D6765_12595 [Bacteroidota bacterium]
MTWGCGFGGAVRIRIAKMGRIYMMGGEERAGDKLFQLVSTYFYVFQSHTPHLKPPIVNPS